MPSFKPKTTKKIKVNKKSNVTLDGKHNEFINEFTKDEQNNLPKLKNEKREIYCFLRNKKKERILKNSPRRRKTKYQKSGMNKKKGEKKRIC